MFAIAAPRAACRRLAGWALLDGLIGIVVLSIGVLGLMALYLSATTHAGEAGYRAEAAFFANEVIGRMWADDKGTLAADYASPDGVKFKPWQADVQAAGTGLPGSTGANSPTLVVTPSNRVIVTLRWQAPGGTAHRYVAEAWICDDTNC